MGKKAGGPQRVERLCDELLRIERGKLAKLMREKERLELERSRVRQLIASENKYSPRLIELSVGRLAGIERQLFQIEKRIDEQRVHVNSAAVRWKTAGAVLRAAREREAFKQRRAEEAKLVERCSWDWPGKAPIR